LKQDDARALIGALGGKATALFHTSPHVREQITRHRPGITNVNWRDSNLDWFFAGSDPRAFRGYPHEPAAAKSATKAADMKPLNLAADLLAATLLAMAASQAGANPWPSGVPVAPPPQPMHNHGFFTGGDVILGVDREYVVEREIIRDVPAAAPAPAAPPPPPRKAYIIGRTYDSLPAGCMKLIDRGATYFHCSGDWYREIRDEGGGRYRAVQQP
jgi:hypothetical protein